MFRHREARFSITCSGASANNRLNRYVNSVIQHTNSGAFKLLSLVNQARPGLPSAKGGMPATECGLVPRFLFFWSRLLVGVLPVADSMDRYRLRRVIEEDAMAADSQTQQACELSRKYRKQSRCAPGRMLSPRKGDSRPGGIAEALAPRPENWSSLARPNYSPDLMRVIEPDKPLR